jgi:cell division protein FtsI/penicillin-binding protein 2
MQKRIKKIIKKIKFIKREVIIFLLFLLAYFIILSKVFSYTVLHYDYYKDLANKQQI